MQLDSFIASMSVTSLEKGVLLDAMANSQIFLKMTTVDMKYQ